MFKPPKTPLLAALILTGACKSTPLPPGTVAETAQPEAVGQGGAEEANTPKGTNAPRPKVGVVAKPSPEVEGHEKPQRHKVGRTAKPSPPR